MGLCPHSTCTSNHTDVDGLRLVGELKMYWTCTLHTDISVDKPMSILGIQDNQYLATFAKMPSDVQAQCLHEEIYYLSVLRWRDLQHSYNHTWVQNIRGFSCVFSYLAFDDHISFLGLLLSVVDVIRMYKPSPEASFF